MTTYQLVLQTISTLAGVVGVGTAIYLGVVMPRWGRRIHDKVDDQTADLKQSIKEQTQELKP